MPRLSSLIETIQDHYAVVVVGSGYGGGIAASRLARAGQKVCVLERGKEFQPGEYPDTQIEALEQMQVDTAAGHVGSHTGLYDLRINPDINVFVGCGLGGTSLINANVSLPADPRVFEDLRWPAALRADLNTRLAEGYQRAQAMLRPNPYPESAPLLPKLVALEKSAKAMNAKFSRLPINVTFQNCVNPAGVEQKACTHCGDCVTGCNVGAKNTTLMNYLPDAKRFGAQIFTQVSVRHLERQGGRWLVHYQLLNLGQESFGSRTLVVSADVVVLAAGTLGSTEILLRSKALGLSASARIGHRFSGNGDVLGFGYNSDQIINGIGFGHRKAGHVAPVGPCITGVIDQRTTPNLEDGIVIEDGSIPGALAPILPGTFALAADVLGQESGRGAQDLMLEQGRKWEDLLLGPYHGATHRTQTYLTMSHDGSNGQMVLEGDRLRVHWPGVGGQPIFKKVNECLFKATEPLHGTYVENPTWTKLLNHNIVTVHPLGGCVMAESAEEGVVNHKGQVFAAETGEAVYDGLYVADGSVIPRSLGVNPLLTISALAERCCALLASDRGWHVDYAEHVPAIAPPVPAPPDVVGIEFTETMKGYFSLQVTDQDFAAGEQRGRADDSSFEFTLSIISEDVKRLIADPGHAACMVGTALAPALSSSPLTVTEGKFSLFVDNSEAVGMRNMTYKMRLSAADGQRYFFSGFKALHPGSLLTLWPETTTLYVTLYRGENEQSSVLGSGILHIHADDFARQLSTTKAVNAPNTLARLEAVAEFGQFFAGVLFQTYGGIALGRTALDPLAPPRKKRPLRAPTPEIYPLRTQDGVALRLTRYRGGAKGPVILVHGLGVSSLIFAIDTIETNLVEDLCRRGYDVWLLDFRNSIVLPAAEAQSNADDVASLDYPAAVEAVLRLTGAESVQIVAHCYGATTFMMAMLAGLKGVRSAVCSQVAAHIVPPVATALKSGLHLPSVLDALGVKSLTAYVDKGANWASKLYDTALALYAQAEAQGRCPSDVCHRITFMYSSLYQHDQLNPATHDALHEMFGVANITAFEHLARMVRAGKLVRADGADVYLPHLNRLAIPITFIHGADNACFLPLSTETTFQLLCQENGPQLYKRHVVPGYGHIDCIFGKRAVLDIYPLIAAQLDAT